MEFKTKYKIGDSFWVMQDNKAVSYVVDNIYINQYALRGTKFENGKIETGMRITYECNEGIRGRVMVKEEEFYPTKAALLATL